MPNLTQIHVVIATGDVNNAGTDGDVYLGICGREFRCDTSADDFERKTNRGYQFGENANVRNANSNDPRNPPLLLEDVDRFPVYIRFQGSDHWFLSFAEVHLNGNILLQYKSRIRNGIWMGKDSGNFLYLYKHIDPGVNPVSVNPELHEGVAEI